jgi:hypothetical protein
VAGEVRFPRGWAIAEAARQRTVFATAFFGYYFQGGDPVAVSGSWTVTLDHEPQVMNLPTALEDLTLGQYAIASHSHNTEPDFLLVHDRRDGACWLWRFAYGLRFVMATEPVSGDDGINNAENRKLLGP